VANGFELSASVTLPTPAAVEEVNVLSAPPPDDAPLMSMSMAHSNSTAGKDLASPTRLALSARCAGCAPETVGVGAGGAPVRWWFVLSGPTA
jgi:hypothetical protein